MEQKIAVQRLLNKRHLVWDRRKGALSESMYIPKDGQQVKVSLLDGHVILGAFKEIDRKGNLVLYCLMEEDGTLRHSLHEEIGVAENWQITPIGTSARSRFADALHREGIVWNGRLKRLEPLEIRINRGGKYYYLNDVLKFVNAGTAAYRQTESAWNAATISGSVRMPNWCVTVCVPSSS